MSSSLIPLGALDVAKKNVHDNAHPQTLLTTHLIGIPFRDS